MTETYSWSFTSPPVTVAKMRNPSASIVSEAFALSIGKVLMQWSAYDRDLTELLISFVRFTGDALQRPERLKYHERATELRRLVAPYVSTNPAAANMIIRMLDEADDLQLRRNIIAHGDLSWTGKFDGKEMHSAMFAKGEFKKQPLEHQYTEDELDTYTYAYAHVAGLISVLNRPATDQWLARSLPPQDVAFLAAVKSA